MRTYYFCTDTIKEMELWMKAMLDAALVQTEPVKRYRLAGGIMVVSTYIYSMPCKYAIVTAHTIVVVRV